MVLQSAVAISDMVMAPIDILSSFRSLRSKLLYLAEKSCIRNLSLRLRGGGSGKSSVMTINGVEDRNFHRCLYQEEVMYGE